MTDVIVAVAIGFLAGLLVGRGLARPADENRTRKFRPTKRQRQILETLAPDPVVPSIHELVVAEAEDLGVNEIPGADRVPLHIRLKVWKRDREALGPCEAGGLRFRLREDADLASADVEDVTLVCEAEPPE